MNSTNFYTNTVSINYNQALENPQSTIQAYDTTDESSLNSLLISIGMIDSEYNLAFAPPSSVPCIKFAAAEKYKKLLEQEILCTDEFGTPLFNLTHEQYIDQFNRFLVDETGIILQTFLRGSYAAYLFNPLDYLRDLILDFLRHKQFPKDNEDRIKFNIQKLLQKPLVEQINTMPPDDIDWLSLSMSPIQDLGKLQELQIKFIAQHSLKKEYYIKSHGFINLKIPKKSNLFPEKLSV